MRIFINIILATCVCLCGSQPVNQFPDLLEVPGDVVYRVGQKVLVLECFTADKEVGIRYSWKKDGKDFPFRETRKNEGTLVFEKPSADVEGHYQCFAQTPVGTASTKVVDVRRTYLEVGEIIPEEHTPVEGRTFHLDCDIPPSFPNPIISWVRQSESGETKPVAGQRLTVSPEGTLYFSNVTEEDTDEKLKYVCLGKTPAADEDVVLAEHYILDVVKDTEPKTNDVIEQYVTNDLVAKIGDVTLLYCIYGGVPLAHPDWYKDGTNVNNSPDDRVTRYNKSVGKRLLIKETLLEDEGSYTCSVDNEVGRPRNHTMHLTIVSAPIFTKTPQSQLNAKSLEDVTIPCQIAAIPMPEVVWTYNAAPLPDNARVHVHRSTITNITTADLTIKKVSPSDTGYYGCRGINEYGDIYAETLLYVS